MEMPEKNVYENCFWKRCFSEKPRNGTTLPGCFAKKGFRKKKFCWKQKEKEEEKLFIKLWRLYRANKFRTTVRPHYPNLGTGLSPKSVEARAGCHNSRGVQVMTPDDGLRSKSEAVNCC